MRSQVHHPESRLCVAISDGTHSGNANLQSDRNNVLSIRLVKQNSKIRYINSNPTINTEIDFPKA